MNGDGFSDVIVGAILNDAGGSNAGRAYVYFGGSAVNNVSDVIMTGAAANDRFGYSVSSAGDMNGDGFSDVLAGAPLNDIGGGNIGRTYLYVSSALPLNQF
ncbi:MAG: FG-GAP repeat protein [Ignavibacteria bacterium]|nr:FG-GAP repeat protein [Ignavibacteria bacterium]